MSTAPEPPVRPLPRQAAKLARPVDPKLISTRTMPGGGKGSYVGHAAITEMLLMVVGPFDLRVLEVIRDGGHGGAVLGCIVELSVEIDGRPTTVQEVGEVELKYKKDQPKTPENDITGHDGVRLKLAMSDGVKRCAMRLGLGLGMWSGNGRWLYDSLVKRAKAQGDDDEADAVDAPEPTADEDFRDPDGNAL